MNEAQHTTACKFHAAVKCFSQTDILIILRGKQSFNNVLEKRHATYTQTVSNQAINHLKLELPL